MRLPQEDLCQATGTPPGRKYEADGGPGIERCLQVLAGARDALPARRRFLETQTLFWMLAAPNGHAKNFSLFLEPGGRYSTTPLYDVMSAHPVMGKGQGKLPPQQLRMAMAAWGKTRHSRWQEIAGRLWRSTAKACGLAAEVEAVLGGLVERTPTVLAQMEHSLPPGFPPQVAESILEGLEAAARRLA